MNKAQAFLESLQPILEVTNVHVEYLKKLASMYLNPPIGGGVDFKDREGIVREYTITGYGDTRTIPIRKLFNKMEDHFVKSKYPPAFIASSFDVKLTEPKDKAKGKFFYKLYIRVRHEE